MRLPDAGRLQGINLAPERQTPLSLGIASAFRERQRTLFDSHSLGNGATVIH